MEMPTSPIRSSCSRSCTKADQVALGVESVVGGITPVSVRIHQAAKIAIGKTRRTASERRRVRCRPSPTGRCTRPRRLSPVRFRDPAGRPRRIDLAAVGFARYLHRHDVKLEFLATTLL